MPEWALEHLWLLIFGLLALAFAISFLAKPGPSTAGLSRRLFWARLLRPGRQVIELQAYAMGRARGGGSWSVNLVFDGPRREHVLLGSGKPCEQDFADAVVAWAKRAARKLQVPGDIVRDSDC